MYPRFPGPRRYQHITLLTLDELERFLVTVFLRRYVTWRVRRRRYTSANEVARLYRKTAVR